MNLLTSFLIFCILLVSFSSAQSNTVSSPFPSNGITTRNMAFDRRNLMFYTSASNLFYANITAASWTPVQIGTSPGYSNGASPSFGNPASIAMDHTNSYLYVADSTNCAIRRVSVSNLASVTTTTAFGADAPTSVCASLNGVGNAARLESPVAIAIDRSSTYMYVFESATPSRIKRVELSTMTLSDLTTSAFSSVNGLAVDSTNSFLYGISGSSVFKVTLNTATTDTYSFSGSPTLSGLVAGGDSLLYVSLTSSNTIWRMDANLQNQELFAGSGSSGSLDGAATSATFTSPNGLALTTSGLLLVQDTNKLRLVSPGPGPVGWALTSSACGSIGSDVTPAGATLNASSSLIHSGVITLAIDTAWFDNRFSILPSPILEFTGANSSCTPEVQFLSGSSTCSRSMRISIPWSQRSACGITASPGFSDGTYDAFISNLKFAVWDRIDMGAGNFLTRKTETLMKPVIRMRKQVIATSSATVNFASTLLLSSAISEQLFDASASTFTIRVATVVAWPLNLTMSSPPVASYDTSKFSNPTGAIYSGGNCANNQQCTQFWTYSFNINSSVCDIASSMTFSWTPACRPSFSGTCPVSSSQVQSFGITLGAVDVCGNVQVTVDPVATVNSYSNAARSVSAVTFDTSTLARMYFRVFITAVANPNSISLNHVEYKKSTDPSFSTMTGQAFSVVSSMFNTTALDVDFLPSFGMPAGSSSSFNFKFFVDINWGAKKEVVVLEQDFMHPVLLGVDALPSQLRADTVLLLQNQDVEDEASSKMAYLGVVVLGLILMML